MQYCARDMCTCDVVCVCVHVCVMCVCVVCVSVCLWNRVLVLPVARRAEEAGPGDTPSWLPSDQTM